MRLAAKSLSALEVKGIQKPGLHAIGTVPGLCLKVDRKLNKSWVLRVVIGPRRRSMGLGGYPSVSLADACRKAREARVLIENGSDPIEARRVAKSNLFTISFAEATKKFIAAKEAEWRNEKHGQQWRNTLATHAADINALPVDAITTPHVLGVLERIWLTKNTTATRVRERIERILDWATVMKFRHGDNPARWKANLDNLLPSPKRVQKSKNFASVQWTEMPAFIKMIQGKHSISAKALEFTILTAGRTGEVIGATWGEIDLKNRRWLIPGARMKSGRDHQVPLSSQAIQLIGDLPRNGDFLFSVSGRRPLSNMAMLNLLRAIETNGPATVHGFRATFRTWAAEKTSYSREVCEAALAHRIGSDTELRYKRTDFLAQREHLMSEWGNFLYQCPND